jgi:hypothetical protein
MSTPQQAFSDVRKMRLEELCKEMYEVDRQLNVIRNRGVKPEDEEEVAYLTAWCAALQKEIWHLKRIRDKIPTLIDYYAMSNEEREPWTCCMCKEPALVEAAMPGVYCSAACAVRAYD